MKPNLLPQAGFACPSPTPQRSQQALGQQPRLPGPLTSRPKQSAVAATESRLLALKLEGLAFKIRALNESSKKNSRDRLVLLRGEDFVLVQPSEGKVLKKLGSLKERNGTPSLSISSEDLNLNSAQAKGTAFNIVQSGEYGVSFKIEDSEVSRIEKFTALVDADGCFEHVEGVDANGTIAFFIHLKALSKAILKDSNEQELKTGTN